MEVALGASETTVGWTAGAGAVAGPGEIGAAVRWQPAEANRIPRAAKAVGRANRNLPIMVTKILGRRLVALTL